MTVTTPLYLTTVPSPVGELGVVVSDAGLRAVLWETHAGRAASGDDVHLVDADEHPVARRAVDQLDDYFTAGRRTFDLPLDLVGTEFQQQAWRALAAIPYGTTTTYGRQAASIGRPTAVRAIGAANRRNPVSIVLPCHRVIGAQGALTGFGGGLETKRWLLDHEQAVTGEESAAGQGRLSLG